MLEQLVSLNFYVVSKRRLPRPPRTIGYPRIQKSTKDYKAIGWASVVETCMNPLWNQTMFICDMPSEVKWVKKAGEGEGEGG